MTAEAVARIAPGAVWRRLVQGRTLPVTTVLLLIGLIWYAAAIGLNAPQVRERLDRSGQPWSTADLIAGCWSMERPVLPTPDQIGAELYRTVFLVPASSKRSLVYHASVTASATLLGFALGTLL